MNPKNKRGMKREKEEEKEEEDRDWKMDSVSVLAVFQTSTRLMRKCTARRIKENQEVWKKIRS